MVMYNLYQLVSVFICILYPCIDSSHHTSEIHSLLQHAGIYLFISTMEENSVHLSIKASKLNKCQSPSALSASVSCMPDGDSADVAVPAIVALVAVFLVLLMLLVAGISIMFFLRQRLKSTPESVTSKYACHATAFVQITAGRFYILHACYAGTLQDKTASRSSNVRR